jgi:opacity protein-like surface antigen
MNVEIFKRSGAIISVLVMSAAQAHGSEFTLTSGSNTFAQYTLYIGGSLGAGNIQINGTTLKADGTIGGSATEEAAHIQDKWSHFGVFVGIHGRLNGRLYVGAEIDWAKLSQRGSFSNIIDNGGIYQGQRSSELIYKTPWLSTVRARVGILADRLIVYSTAGLALSPEHEKRSQYQGDGVSSTNVTLSDSARVLRLGATIGGGLEWKLTDSVFIRSEYLFVAFPKELFTFPNARGGAGGSYSDIQGRLARNQSNLNVVRFAIGYSF